MIKRWIDENPLFPRQVKEIENSIDEIQEKIWELDKSWRNNLVFYGIRSDSVDEHPSVTESKIKDVIARQLRISREVPMTRVRRTAHGHEVFTVDFK